MESRERWHSEIFNNFVKKNAKNEKKVFKNLPTYVIMQTGDWHLGLNCQAIGK